MRGREKSSVLFSVFPRNLILYFFSLSPKPTYHVRIRHLNKCRRGKILDLFYFVIFLFGM